MSRDSCPATSTKEPTDHLTKPANKTLFKILAEVPSWWGHWAFSLFPPSNDGFYFIILKVEREQGDLRETWPDQEVAGNEVTLSLKQVAGIAGQFGMSKKVG